MNLSPCCFVISIFFVPSPGSNPSTVASAIITMWDSALGARHSGVVRGRCRCARRATTISGADSTRPNYSQKNSNAPPVLHAHIVHRYSCYFFFFLLTFKSHGWGKRGRTHGTLSLNAALHHHTLSAASKWLMKNPKRKSWKTQRTA